MLNLPTERRKKTESDSATPNRVVRDTGTLMAGDVFDRGLGAVFLFTATKLFGFEIYGAYQLALAVFQVVRTVVSFGLGRSLVRDTAAAAAADDPGRVKGAILFGMGVSVSIAVVFGLGLFFGAPLIISRFYPKHPEAIEPLRVFGLLTPLFAVNFVILQAFYGLDRVRLMVIANNAVEPLTRLAALLTLFVAGVSGYYALPSSYLLALVASSFFAIVLFKRHFWSTLAPAKPEYRVRETLAFSLPVTLNDLATRSFRSFNVFMLAPFLTSAQLGIFATALKLTSVVLFFSGSLTAAFRPRIARLLASGQKDVLEAETRAYNRWILTFALLPFGLLILFPVPLLRTLGEQFVQISAALQMLAFGLLVAQSAGPLMALLLMSGRSKPPLVFIVIGGSAYTAMALWLVPRYGVEGATAAAVVAILAFVPALSVYVQRALEIRIYGRTMWKPLAAGAAAFGVAYVVSLVAPDVRGVDAAMIAGSAVVVYLGALVGLGVEPEERALLGELLGPTSKLRRKLGKLRR